MTDQSDERESFWEKPWRPERDRSQAGRSGSSIGPWGWCAIVSLVALAVLVVGGPSQTTETLGGIGLIYLVIYLVRGAYLLARRLIRRLSRFPRPDSTP